VRGAQQSPAADEQLTPVLASVLAVPAAAPLSDGRWVLPYELALANVADVPMTIESLEVRDARGVVATVHGTDVAAHLSIPGRARTATLGAGQTGVLFVNVSVSHREDLPTSIEHQLTARTSQPHGALRARTVERVAATAVSGATPIVLGPPLRGGRWVAAASCCESYHRRAVLPIDGARWLAQRFAIDWMMLDDADRMAEGDPHQNRSFPQYGRDVLAVADGTVVRAVDGLPDGQPGAFPTGTTITNADGNSIVLDLGGGRFALFAHLQPGSLRVREGDRVTRGQVLGSLGNSGNSDLPHLHFHIMDGPSPLASSGLPYVIERFELLGTAVSDDDLEREGKTPHRRVEVRAVEPAVKINELPADLAVVRFPD
jgi:hypothetical protein